MPRTLLSFLPCPFDQGVVEQHVKLTAMHGVLRPVVSGFQTARFRVNFRPVQSNQRPFQSGHANCIEAFGIKAWKVENPDDLEGALRSAVDHPGPTLVDIISQPLQEANAPVSEWIA